MKLFIFNAPPRAGKTTAINELLTEPYFFTTKASEYVGRAVASLLGIPYDQWLEFYEDNKDCPLDTLGGMTPREVYIDLSENWAKLRFGDDFFGLSAVRYLRSNGVPQHPDQLAMVTDLGFVEEALPLVKHFGPQNTYLIHIERKGCSYSNDSRGPIFPDDIGIPDDNFDVILNSGSKEVFLNTVQSIVMPEISDLIEDYSNRLQTIIDNPKAESK